MEIKNQYKSESEAMREVEGKREGGEKTRTERVSARLSKKKKEGEKGEEGENKDRKIVIR